MKNNALVCLRVALPGGFRMNLSKAKLERQVIGALKNTIDAHGPITKDLISSAAKRVTAQIIAAENQKEKADVFTITLAEDEVIISKTELEKLERAQAILYALYDAGVDNWEGFDIAINSLEEA